MNVRAHAAKVLFQVVEQGKSLSIALPEHQKNLTAKDKALLQFFCYGVLRTLPRLDFFCRSLMKKPLKGKLRDVHFLILVGLYQLLYTRVPNHAAVSETVNALQSLKKPGFKGVVNGVLRGFMREEDLLTANANQQPALVHCHPGWLIKRLTTAYGENIAEKILTENNQQAPMWLRVNAAHYSAKNYQTQLKEEKIESETVENNRNAVKLIKAVDVHCLPGFSEGAVSVQDGGAQLAAHYLSAQTGDFVLDACAAPGGKTAHILELQPGITKMVASDIDGGRLLRVEENLQRLNLKATLLEKDASTFHCDKNEQMFDRILCDAPCSATGVIRRHPDIRWLRRDSDIAQLAALQKKILHSLWEVLKPGGVLLYSTCSVLPEENELQVKAFLKEKSDATLIPLSDDEDFSEHGRQILPNEQGMDGFYYAKLQKAKKSRN